MQAAVRFAFTSMMVGCASGQPQRSAAPPRAGASQLVIAQRFVERTSVALRLSASRDSVTADSRVRLLRAAAAPEAHTLTLRAPRVCGAFDGALSALSVEAPVDAPIRAEVRDGAVVLRSIADGAAEIAVRGEYVQGQTGCEDGLAAGARVPVRARVRVEASSEAGRASIGGAGRCGSIGGPFAGARSPVSLSPVLLDAANDPVSFANVYSLAPFEIRVESELSLSVLRDGRLVLPERSGLVRLSIPGQRRPLLWRWRVPPAAITEATVRFFIGGATGAPVDVTEGARIAGSHRKVGAVFVQIRSATAGDEPLCDAADPRWFELRSETPDVCAVRAIDAQACDQCGMPAVATQAAWLLRDGVCSIRVEAPSLNQGRGLRWRVSAAFERVDQFAGNEAASASP